MSSDAHPREPEGRGLTLTISADAESLVPPRSLAVKGAFFPIVAMTRGFPRAGVHADDDRIHHANGASVPVICRDNSDSTLFADMLWFELTITAIRLDGVA
jgi:hypothetical protein